MPRHIVLAAFAAACLGLSACGDAGDNILAGSGPSTENRPPPPAAHVDSAKDAGIADAATAPPSGGDAAPPPGITDNEAKAFFIQVVYPSLLQTCGNCHSPPPAGGAPVYLPKTSGADAYAAVEARGYIVPGSLLLKKGSHEGPALTTQQATDVSHWLDLEAKVRGTQAPVNLLAKLGDCLDATKFDSIGLDQLRTVPRDGENPNTCVGCNDSPCQSCHQQGEYAMHANFGALGTKTIDALKANGTSPEGIFLVSKYITTNGTTLVPSTAIPDKATTTATGTPYSHPMFQVDATTAQAISAFASDAIAKYNAKQCGH